MLYNIIIEQKDLKFPRATGRMGFEPMRACTLYRFLGGANIPVLAPPSPLYGEADSPASLKLFLSQTPSIELMF